MTNKGANNDVNCEHLAAEIGIFPLGSAENQKTEVSDSNGTYLSRYGLLLEEMSAAGKPPSSLHGRIHGVFRKK